MIEKIIDLFFERILVIMYFILFTISFWTNKGIEYLLYYGFLAIFFALNEIYWVLKRKKQYDYNFI